MAELVAPAFASQPSDSSASRPELVAASAIPYLQLLVPPAAPTPQFWDAPAAATGEALPPDAPISGALVPAAGRAVAVAPLVARGREMLESPAVTVPIPAYPAMATLGLGVAMYYGGSRWLRLRR